MAIHGEERVLKLANVPVPGFPILGYVSVEAFGAVSIDSDLQTIELPAGGSDVDGQVCYDVSAGLVPGLGLEGLFGLFSSEFQLPGVEWPIGQPACVDYSEVSTCAESDECVVDADCRGGLSPICEAPVCTSNCTCSRIAIENCCTHDDECDDQDPDTTDLCMHNRCKTLSPMAFEGFCFEDAHCDDESDAIHDTCNIRTFGERGSCHFEPIPEQEEQMLFGATGVCSTAAQCDDGDATTEDTCYGFSCLNVAIPPDPCDTLICSDRDATTADSCINGACVHTSIAQFTAPL